jgi:hypothetical protein
MAMEREEEVRKRLRGRFSIHFKMAGAWDTGALRVWPFGPNCPFGDFPA